MDSVNYLTLFWIIHSTAHSLDNLSSERARPMYSTKNRVNGNEAHLLDERLRFGSAGSLTSVSGVIPANHQMRLFNKWKSPRQFLTFHLPPPLFHFPQHKNLNSHAVNSFIPCNTVILKTHHWQLSGPYHLRLYLIRAFLQIPCRFFGDHTFHFWASIWAADWECEILLLRFSPGRWESIGL